jgi:hypothetical protein
MLNLRQLFFGIYDMTIHTSDGKSWKMMEWRNTPCIRWILILCFTLLDENLDTSKVYNDLRKKISLIAAPEVNRIIYTLLWVILMKLLRDPLAKPLLAIWWVDTMPVRKLPILLLWAEK